MKVVDNYESKIWLGLQEGYSGIEENPKTIKGFIEGWCTGKRQCVTVIPIEFIYSHGRENGLIIGFINYPIYPLSQAEIKNRTIELGELLMKRFKQYRVSLTFYPSISGGTMMLENENLKEK